MRPPQPVSSSPTDTNFSPAQSQVPFYLLTAIQNWLSLVLELAVAGMITLIVGLAVGLRHKIDPGYLGLALISAVSPPPPLFSLRVSSIPPTNLPRWTSASTSAS